MKPFSLSFQLSCGFWNAVLTAKIISGCVVYKGEEVEEEEEEKEEEDSEEKEKATGLRKIMLLMKFLSYNILKTV